MTSAAEWAREFFSGLFVDLWLGATTEPQTRQEADFLEKALRLSPGARVLDVPCGGGRHSLELAGRGYRVTGVDISDQFLAVARSAADRAGRSVAWEQRPMQDLPWEAAFDGAFCLGNSLGGQDDAGHAAFFGAVARALKPGARFVVDSGVIAESILPHLQERTWWQMGDILFVVHNRYDPARGRLNMDFTLIRDGRVEKRSGFSQVYTYREFCRLVEQAGFGEVEGYGALTQEPYRLGAHYLYLVATRKGG